MSFLEPRPASINRTTRMLCDKCGAEYGGKPKTADKHENLYGKHLCPRCVHVLVGRRVGEQQRERLRIEMNGDGNIAKHRDVRDAISKANTGRKFTDKHRSSLRKPKSKTELIKAAANRPEERHRRRDRMIARLQQGGQVVNGMFSNCDVGFVQTEKTPVKIWCRSGAEKRFVELCSEVDNVLTIKSAETIRINYEYNSKDHVYLPDFLVLLTNGTEYIVEIKSSYLRNRGVTVAKELALAAHCWETGKCCVTLTEKEIEQWVVKLRL